MEIKINGKTVKNVIVMYNIDSKNIPYTLVTDKGQTYSLVMNRKNPEMLGVVKRGSLNYHKFRGYEWMKKEGNNLIGVS
jgi:hypothetical protein